MDSYAEWQKKASHYKNLTQMARDRVKTTRNENPVLAEQSAPKKKVTLYGEGLSGNPKTDSANTFVTGVGLGEEDVPAPEKKPMPVPDLRMEPLEDLENEEKNQEITYESLLKDTDDLEEVRRMIKSVSHDIGNYEADLRGITSSVSALNKDLKAMGMGFDDGIINEIQDSFKHLIYSKGSSVVPSKGISGKSQGTGTTGTKDRGSLAKSSVEQETQKIGLPQIKKFKVRTNSALNKKRG